MKVATKWKQRAKRDRKLRKLLNFRNKLTFWWLKTTTALDPKTGKCKCKFPLVRNDGKEYCGKCNEDI